jgi:glutamate synthase (NADPH/NADH) small chain
MGAKDAIIAYRRGKDELPARDEEIHHAEEEGVKFELMASPVQIVSNDEGWVSGVECQMMELGEPDDSGRRRPTPIADSEYIIDCDMVVVAIGTRSNPMLTSSEPDLKINEWGYLVVDDTGMTSVPGIFAGGDIVRGAATVILAMGDGKRAARAIEQYLGSVAELLPSATAAAKAEADA